MDIDVCEGHTDGPGLLALDTNSLLQIVSLVQNARDLVHLQLTCSVFRQLLKYSEVWSSVLESQYGLVLQGRYSTRALDVVKLLHQDKNTYAVRFKGVFTDGGVDAPNASAHYWADHMFVPNSWAPFCSELSSNINCIGVLKVAADAEELAHRAFLISRIKWPAILIQEQPNVADPMTHQVLPWRLRGMEAQMQSWKTVRLEHWFVQAFLWLEMGDPMGMSLMREMPGTPAANTLLLRERALAIRHKPWYSRSFELVQVPGGRPQELADRTQLGGALLAPQAVQSVAIVEGVAVSREGHFSCPVQCGALLVGVLPHTWPPHGAEPTPEGCSSLLQGMVGQANVAALNGLTSAEAVLSASEAGRLPPWLRHVWLGHAEYVEFAVRRGDGGPGAGAGPYRTVEGGGPELHPVVWFRMYDHATMWRRRQVRRSLSALKEAMQLLSSAADAMASSREVYTAKRAALEQLHARARQPRAQAAGQQQEPGPQPEAMDVEDDAEGAQAFREQRAEGRSQAAEGVAPAGGSAERSPRAAADLALEVLRHGVPIQDRVVRPGADALQGLRSLVLAEQAYHRRVTQQQAAHAQAAAMHLAQAAVDGGGGPAGGGAPAPAPAAPAALLPQQQAMMAALNPLASDEFRAVALGAVDSLPERLFGALNRAAEAVGGAKREPEPPPPCRFGFMVSTRSKALPMQQPSQPSTEAAAAAFQEISAVLEELAAKCGWLAEQLRAAHAQLTAIAIDHPQDATGASVNRQLASALGLDPDALVASAVDAAGGAAALAACDGAGSAGAATDGSLDAAGGQATGKASGVEGSSSASGGSSGRSSHGGDARPSCSGSLAGAGCSSSSGSTAAGASGVLSPAAMLQPPPPPGYCAPRLFDPLLQRDIEADQWQAWEEGGAVAGAAHDLIDAAHLALTLARPLVANVACVKLISPENLMSQVGWDNHDAPNVDIQYVAMRGRVLTLLP